MVHGAQVTGTVRMPSWPADAPITDGRFDGQHLTFAASRAGSIRIEAITMGDTMRVMVLQSGRAYRYLAFRASAIIDSPQATSPAEAGDSWARRFSNRFFSTVLIARLR